MQYCAYVCGCDDTCELHCGYVCGCEGTCKLLSCMVGICAGVRVHASSRVGMCAAGVRVHVSPICIDPLYYLTQPLCIQLIMMGGVESL